MGVPANVLEAVKASILSMSAGGVLCSARVEAQQTKRECNKSG